MVEAHRDAPEPTVPPPSKRTDDTAVIEPVWKFTYASHLLEFQTCVLAVLSVPDTVLIRCGWEPWINGRWEIEECKEIEVTGPAICWLQTYGSSLNELSKEDICRLNGYEIIVRLVERQ